MNNCRGCKYRTKIINEFRSWCKEPTFPTGVIVYTKGWCDQWTKGGLTLVPTPKKKDKTEWTKRPIPIRSRTFRHDYQFEGTKARAFNEKYFRRN